VILFGGHPAREVTVDAALVGVRVDAVQALSLDPLMTRG
jgi:hypothetical protein